MWVMTMHCDAALLPKSYLCHIVCHISSFSNLFSLCMQKHVDRHELDVEKNIFLLTIRKDIAV